MNPVDRPNFFWFGFQNMFQNTQRTKKTKVRLSSSPQLFIDHLSVSMYFVVLIHCLLDNLHPRHTILEPLACTKQTVSLMLQVGLPQPPLQSKCVQSQILLFSLSMCIVVLLHCPFDNLHPRHTILGLH